jgi:membrane-bound inhibitor of C-type lysozyme
MNHAYWNAGILHEWHKKNNMNLKSTNNITFVFGTLLLISCGNDDQSSSITSSAYYACDDNLVIQIEYTSSAMYAAIFKGKELLMGRDLVRDSVSEEELFSTDDISITLSGDTIEVITKNIHIANCYLSKSEMERRGKRDTYHYISDAGALITTKNISTNSIQFQLKLGSNVVVDTILPQVPSASGTKYQQGDIMFWIKQNTAMLVYQGVLYGHCVAMFEDEVAYSACTDTALHTGVVGFLKTELVDDMAFIPGADRRYYAERADINNDGQEEIYVALANSYFCGSGGCSWYILHPDFSMLAKFSVSDFPIYLSDSFSNGYRDLYVRSGGKYHTLKYHSGYPSNPSTESVFDLFSHPEYTTGGTKRVLEWAYLKGCQF